MAVVLPFSPASDASIDRLVDQTNADMARVNTEILSRTGSEVTMIPEVANTSFLRAASGCGRC